MKTVYLYDGVIPKSGKAVIEFGGHKLVHRSIGKDKSDILVHIDSKIVVRAYPLKTDRSIILNDLAENIEVLEHFISHPEEFMIEDRPKLLKNKDNYSEVVYDTYKEPSYSKSGSFAHLNQDSSCVTGSCSSTQKFKQEFMLPIKKKYNLKDAEW